MELGALLGGGIGGILVLVGMIASFVFYIIAIVKAFQANDTLWGVLNIFIGICGLIWLFLNGHKKLGIFYIVAILLTVVGSVMAGAAGAMMGIEGMEGLEVPAPPQ